MLMPLDPKFAAALALHRFCLGPRRGSIAAIASDPRGALLAELDRPDIGQIVAKREADERQRAMGMAEPDKSTVPNELDATLPNPEERNVVRDTFRAEASARFTAALGAELGFAERLVWFWSNHFCISADKVPSFAGSYEREAIRSHALGRFADMLLAAESHPGMLYYLDNAASIGPNSVAGINRSRGLNENLAREILELHT